MSIPTTLRSVPASQFTIDYYQSPAADPSTYGEGSNYIGSVNVQTDGNGFAGFTFTSANPVIPTQLSFTATATDLFGNTSEFSCSAGVCTTGTFQEALESPEATCIEPIIVNINSNESDPNTADGFCDVDTNNTGLQCSLRAAIQEANARNGFDIINFDIPGAGVHTISIPAALKLPHITERVMINGTTQPGYNGTPLIEVSGIIEDDQLPGQGFVIDTSRVEISGLAINRFAGNIFIGGAGFTTNDNFIYGCFIGMHPDGTVDTIAGQYGIAVGGSSKNNKIGAQYFEPNVVANTVIGIQLAGSGVQNNQIANNKIGTDRAGTSAKANYGGILIGSNAKNNLIGGELEGEGNVISGNALNGVSIGTNAEANKISGNLIGTDVTGNFVIRNGMEGIKLTSGAKLNIIGGPASQRNIISGNGGGVDPARGFQILIEATAIQNEIYGNYIGLKKDGSEGLGGITGIGCAGNNNKIGGYQTMPNVIASQQVGIALGSGDPGLINSNQVSYNRIGTNPAGTSSSANTFGILAIGQVVNTSINHNLISGNQAAGILLRDGVTSTTISENRIGTDINGNLAINSLVGIAVIKSSSNNIINNQISGNSAVGLLFGDDLVQPPANINEIVKQFAPAESPNGTPQYTDLNVVEGNRIGTDAVGTNPIPNGIGIIVGQNARDNQIGGKRSEGKGNVISGHTLQAGSAGIILGPIVNTTSDQFPQGNKVQGNRIGIRALSFQPLPNNIGIVFNGAGTNIIGAEDISCPDPNVPCDASDFGNIIGGNISDGVREENSGSTANLIKRNFIGVAPDGTAIPNGGNGVAIYNPQDVTVTENTICNSGGNGILVQGNAPARDEIGRPPVKRELGGFLTKISGNIIGLKILNGISKAPNALAGIKLSNINGVLVGNNQQGASKNLISGNDGPGVLIEGYNSYSNQINNSIIGTDSEGTLDLGNGGDGVKLVNASANVIGDNVGAGGRDATISGNTGNGVSIEGQGAVYNSVLSNAIGVIRTNNNAFLRVANQQNGVVIQNAANNAIGGVFGQVGNKISGNLRSGILIIGSNSINNLVKRNLIGIDQIGTAFGNTMHGIHLTQGASNNIVGGDETDAGNTIGGNGGNGIFIEDGQPPPRTEGTQSTQNNRFTRNNIFGNSGLGIDIFPAGANPNDGGDGDGGPNRGQNYPEIETYYIDGNGDLIVFYLLDTDPANANYGVNGIKIEFFISDAAGQGRFPIASNQFWTVSDYNNTGSKQINLGNAAQLGFQLGDSLTAAATDADGNTSEFVATGFVPSPTPTASSTPTPDPVISGTITYGNAIGSPAQRFVSNALVHAAGSTISMTTATGANGEYSLSGFDSGAYTITPSKTGGQNNAISSFDAALISQHVLGAPLPSLIGNQLVVADVSGNGTISSFDAAQIARYVVSLPPTGSTGNWKFNPASNSYPSITSSITGEDYSALLMGEVSGDWDSVGSRRSAVGSDIVVDMPEMTVSENSELIIPVGVKGIADKGIISYEFNLKYDPFVIRPQADPIDLAGTTSRNLTAVFNAETPGLLRVAVYGPMPITGDGVLLNLRFTSVGQSGTTSKLIWQRMIFNEGLSAATKDGLVQIF
ncbi:MAG: cohesin domain-containing protein [Pyrinomonadaceae bacterium]